MTNVSNEVSKATLLIGTLLSGYFSNRILHKKIQNTCPKNVNPEYQKLISRSKLAGFYV